MKITNEEKLLKHLLDKFNKSQTNVVYLYLSDLESLEIEEKEASRLLYVLQEDDKIVISKNPVNKDFSFCWTINLKSTGIHYFDNKQEHIKAKRVDRFRFWVPVILSAIAIIASIVTGVRVELVLNL